MWSGRFREPLDPDFDHWQRSFSFDRILLWEEISASKAHSLALLDAGVLAPDEQKQIAEGLMNIYQTSSRSRISWGSRRLLPSPWVTKRKIFITLSRCSW